MPRGPSSRIRILDPRTKVKYFGEFQEFQEFDAARRAPPVSSGTYPQVINKFIVFREFGSLKGLDTDRGPRAVHHITRAQDPRFFGPGP